MSPLPEKLRRMYARAGRGVAAKLPRGVVRSVNVARGIQTPRLVDHPPGLRPAVLSPHPDDEVIGLGGTLRGHVAAGAAPLVVHVTSGERTAGLVELPTAERVATREAEALAAAHDLGIADGDVVFMRAPDGGVDSTSPAQKADLVRLLGAHRADLVYAPWPIDAHRDHVETARLLAAALPELPDVGKVALYEVWTALAPTHVVDVTAQMPAKLAALRCYRSALTTVNYIRTVEGLAAYRSAQCLHGEGYAEAFAVLDVTAFDDLLARIDRP